MRTSKNIFSRWHCYDNNGNKVIRQFAPDETNPTQIDDWTPWVRGNGPFDDISYRNVVTALRRSFEGKAKSAEQKAKMSAAATGRPKSAAHRAAMCISQQRRYGKG